jgi:hypothetical protein
VETCLGQVFVQSALLVLLLLQVLASVEQEQMELEQEQPDLEQEQQDLVPVLL